MTVKDDCRGLEEGLSWSLLRRPLLYGDKHLDTGFRSTQAGFSGLNTLTYLSKVALNHQSQLDNKHDFKDIFSCRVVKLNQKNYFDTTINFIMALFEKLLRMEDVALFLDRLSVYSGKTGLSR